MMPAGVQERNKLFLATNYVLKEKMVAIMVAFPRTKAHFKYRGEGGKTIQLVSGLGDGDDAGETDDGEVNDGG